MKIHKYKRTCKTKIYFFTYTKMIMFAHLIVYYYFFLIIKYRDYR